MKILAVGDIVGNLGVKKLKKELNKIKEEFNIDFTIVNSENAAEGFGITEKNFQDIVAAGADCLTMGNHTFGKKDIFNFIDDPKIIRPINYPEGVCGKGCKIYKVNDKKIAVMNALGRAEINLQVDNPFLTIEKAINEIQNTVDLIILDFHAEATAEKQTMGYFLDGKATIVFGTHTHIQTADEQILQNGTAYITDIGMTGPKDGVIGMNKDVAFKRFLTALPERYKIAEGETMLNGCIFEVDDKTNKVTKIYRISK